MSAGDIARSAASTNAAATMTGRRRTIHQGARPMGRIFVAIATAHDAIARAPAWLAPPPAAAMQQARTRKLICPLRKLLCTTPVSSRTSNQGDWNRISGLAGLILTSRHPAQDPRQRDGGNAKPDENGCAVRHGRKRNHRDERKKRINVGERCRHVVGIYATRQGAGGEQVARQVVAVGTMGLPPRLIGKEDDQQRKSNRGRAPDSRPLEGPLKSHV